MKRPRRTTRARRKKDGNRIDALFDIEQPTARAAFDALLRAVEPFGPVRVEAEDSAIQLHAGSDVDAFAIVNPKRIGIMVRLRSLTPMTSLRVLKTQRLSAELAHNEILILHIRGVDEELTRWLRTAYRLSSDAG